MVFGLESLSANIAVGMLAVGALVLSAEFLVHQLVKLAHHFGVSNTFIGLTVMSVGTSLPEIGSHLTASIGILTGKLDYKVASSTVLGANIGSDVIQQTFVLGLVVLIVGKLVFTKEFLKSSYLVMIGTTLLTLILGFDGTISRVDGAILFGAFLAYMYYLYRKEQDHDIEHVPLEHHIAVEIGLVVVGMAILIFSSAVALSTIEKVVAVTSLSGSLIGVISIGVASALPEMVTALSGLRQSAGGISVGTLIGSNITNPLLAIGLGGLVSTYYVPKPLIYWDLPMETVTAALLLLWLLMTKKELKRGGAIYLIALYGVYLAVRIVFFGVD